MHSITDVTFNQKSKLTQFYEKFKGAIRDRDQKQAEALVSDCISSDGVKLPHPDYKNIDTHCRDSKKDGLTNVLYFSDREGNNKWALIQITSFIDAIYRNGECSIFMASPINIVKSLFSKNKENLWVFFDDQNALPSKRFGGFVISQQLPYHFFYDGLVNLKTFLSLANEADVVSINKKPFIDTYSVVEKSVEPGNPNEYYYVYPALLNGMRLFGRNSEYMGRAYEMESDLKCIQAPKNGDDENLLSYVRERKEIGDPVIWYGVSNGKRKWHQQVEAASRVIAEARKVTGKRPVLLLDGHTAEAGQRVVDHEDQKIVNRIIDELGDDGEVNVVSLIGREYASKINLGRYADLFISYSGTGAFVPLRVCQLPGVIHKNESLFSFPDDYGDRVFVLTGEDLDDASKKGAGFVDYSIPISEFESAVGSVTRKNDLPYLLFSTVE